MRTCRLKQVILEQNNAHAHTCKTIVGEGCVCHINVTVENQGNKVEGFNVEVYASLSLIFSEYKLLASGSVTFVFVWNTTGWSKGYYSISASIPPVPEETDTADNTMIDEITLATIPGDVD